MSQKEFNEFLGNYLSSKRRPKKRLNVKKIFKKEKKEDIPELTNGVQIVETEKPLLRRLFKKKPKEKKEYEGDIPKEEVEKELAAAEFDSEEEELEEEIEASPTLKERLKNFFTRKQEPMEDTRRYDDEGYLITELEELEQKEEELINQEKMLKSRRRGLIRSIIQMFKEKPEMQQEVTEDTSEETSELEEDLKEVSRFATDVIKRLPRRKIEDLKKSDEFKRFKEILRKRQLIKEG
ncbi:MAG: hypothetical protein ACLFP2_03455 [Candidatus Woesearchaeota archaeon]